jgi:hypothetical protein
VCVNTCDAHIYYVLPRNKDTTRACIHIGTHAHPMRKGTCKETFLIIKQLIGVERMRMLNAKNLAIQIVAKA